MGKPGRDGEMHKLESEGRKVGVLGLAGWE